MNSSTSTSKRWLALYLCALLFSLGVGWFYTTRFEPETAFWAMAFEERREGFVKGSKERKVIFTGDSACAFGIDPELFFEESGLAAYNLGGTRQMGMRIFMNEALSQASQGDVIVLIANPVLLATEADADLYPKAGARMALALSEELSLVEFLDATRPGFNHLVSLGAKVVFRMPMFRYGKGDLQPNGQVVTAKRDHSAPTREEFEMKGRVAKVASVLRYWQERCREEGVHLCYLLPIELTDSSILRKNRRKKSELLRELEKREVGVRIIKTSRAGCSDDEAIFADTLFHFTEEGAADFTRRLVPILGEAIERF